MVHWPSAHLLRFHLICLHVFQFTILLWYNRGDTPEKFSQFVCHNFFRKVFVKKVVETFSWMGRYTRKSCRNFYANDVYITGCKHWVSSAKFWSQNAMNPQWFVQNQMMSAYNDARNNATLCVAASANVIYILMKRRHKRRRNRIGLIWVRQCHETRSIEFLYSDATAGVNERILGGRP